MRFPEAKIKDAILHPNSGIRCRTTRYFGKSFSQDRSLMPLVIESVETYGKQDADYVIGSARDLPQTEETIAWLIEELNHGQSDEYENYTYNLSMVLIEADPTLLVAKESAILEARHFTPALRTPLSERLQMLSWDEGTCWQKLEDFCEDSKDKQYINEVNLGYARRVVEALARYGQNCESKVHAVLNQTTDDDWHPLHWLQPLVIRLAGLARLDSTIPLIISSLLADNGDLSNEECAEALTRIGTSAVVAAIAATYPTAPHHFRIYAMGALEYIHSDLAVDTCIQFVSHEKDRDLRFGLVQSLLTQFASAGIDAARQELMGRELGFEGEALRSSLLETCVITGERFPEYDQWLAADKQDTAERRRRVKELEDDPEGLLRFAVEKLSGNPPSNKPKAEPLILSAPSPDLLFNSGRSLKVGRNETCPCGSGKKYKQCCMRKQGMI